jgi:hypothetical protein
MEVHEQYQDTIENPLINIKLECKNKKAVNHFKTITQINISSATGMSYHGDVGIKYVDDGNNGGSNSSLYPLSRSQS